MSASPPRNLLNQPVWEPRELGLPLPPVTHAVSVALPCWQDVVDYEEEHPRIAAALQAGYPRFFLHPLVARLFAVARERFANPGEDSIVFPNPGHAQAAAAYVEKRTGTVGRIESFGAGELQVLSVPQSDLRIAREFWRYTGAVVSSRLAEWALQTSGPAADPASGSAGMVAREEIRSRLAESSGVAPGDVFLFASGMSAGFAAHRLVTAVRPGLKSVQLDFPYVDVLRVQQEFGNGVHFFPVADGGALQQVESLAQAQTISSVFAEVPSNPLLSCVTLDHLAPVLRQNGIPLVLDDTVATSINLRATALADLVTTSLTKAFSGVGDVIAGALTLNPDSPHYRRFRELLHGWDPDGKDLWAGDAVVLAENSRDYPERVIRMNHNAEALTTFLKAHPAVGRVWYPEGPGAFGSMARQGGGCGSLFSFILKDPAATPDFYNRLRISKGPSLGTNFSLCCPYTLLAHYQELDWAASCGVPRHLLRVSAGLEEAEELVRRFATALAHA